MIMNDVIDRVVSDLNRVVWLPDVWRTIFRRGDKPMARLKSVRVISLSISIFQSFVYDTLTRHHLLDLPRVYYIISYIPLPIVEI